eukprot:1781406-Prymnesium_polylepis.1
MQGEVPRPAATFHGSEAFATKPEISTYGLYLRLDHVRYRGNRTTLAVLDDSVTSFCRYPLNRTHRYGRGAVRLADFGTQSN